MNDRSRPPLRVRLLLLLCRLLGVELRVLYRHAPVGEIIHTLKWRNGGVGVTIFPEPFNRVEVKPALHVRTNIEREFQRELDRAVWKWMRARGTAWVALATTFLLALASCAGKAPALAAPPQRTERRCETRCVSACGEGGVSMTQCEERCVEARAP